MNVGEPIALSSSDGWIGLASAQLEVVFCLGLQERNLAGDCGSFLIELYVIEEYYPDESILAGTKVTGKL